MRILLTGGTGFIGEALSLRLLRDGHELRLFARVGQVTGRPPPRQAPQQVVRPLLTASDAIASLLRLRLGLRGAEAILVQRYFFDAHVAVSELGLPQTPIDDAIERTVASLSV